MRGIFNCIKEGKNGGGGGNTDGQLKEFRNTHSEKESENY